MKSELGRHAVIGHPVAHSLSPRIQRAFAAQFGATIDYGAVDAAPDRFAEIVRGFFAGGGVGLNVTVPHKRAALELADRRDASATLPGAANVLMPRDGRLVAYNTDGSGFVRDLIEHRRFAPRGAWVLLLGAGGAARGVGFALREAGIEWLVVANRTLARAAALADGLGPNAQAQPWPDIASGERFDLIVNATAAGLLDDTLALSPALLAGKPLCYDLAYGAAAEPFVAWARARGTRAVDGLGMLIETAADSFALWHHERPDTTPVRADLGVT